MKKLLLIPTFFVTVFLIVAFVAPATATGILRTVAPVLQGGGRAAEPVAEAAGRGAGSTAVPGDAVPGNDAARSSAGAPQSSTPVGGISPFAVDRSHGVATAGQTNCGRLGNGHHGGKHDFICPNQPFS